MSRKTSSHFIKAILLTAVALNFSTVSSSADDIPMTIDGQINCAHPANAITTTCKGEAPPPPVNTPAVTHEAPSPAAPASTSNNSNTSAPVVPAIPMTIDGQINCAHPDNAVTTTCWDRAQASKISGTTDPNAVDCNLNQYKDYPVCTGLKPQAVLDYEKSREGAAQVPAPNTETLEVKSVDCSIDTNKDSPYCLPMTINGEVNCAQASNAVTTTCWEQAVKEKAAGRLFPNGVDCSKEAFKTYPVCTGVKPQAVVDFEKSQEVAKTVPTSNTECANPANVGSAACSPAAIAEADKKTQLEQAATTKSADGPASVPEVSKPQVSGSIDLKSRNSKTTILTLDLDISNVKVKIIASKKGAPSITQQVVANAEGNKTIKFSKNLKGYTVKVYVDGQVVDQTRVY